MHATVTNIRYDDPWRAELNYGNRKVLVRKAILRHSELSGGKNENKKIDKKIKHWTIAKKRTPKDNPRSRYSFCLTLSGLQL